MSAPPAVISNNFRAGLDDRVNPIVIKELRQAVQSRFVVAALLVLLVIQLTVIAIFLLLSDSRSIDLDTGRQVFMVLYGFLLGISILFVPLYTAFRLIGERSDNDVDLLFITTIKPRSIIAGKILAAIIITILIFSACLPFMVFTYFLRGIDLLSIFVVLALGFSVVIVSSQLAILIGSLPVNRVFKVMLGLTALFIFFLTHITILAVSSDLVFTGVGSRLADPEFWEIALGLVCLFVILAGIPFMLSVSLITSRAANRALPVRIFITSGWLVFGVGAFIAGSLKKNYTPIRMWLIVYGLIFAIAIFIAVSERDQLERRVLKDIPAGYLKRALAFVFFSGAASGLVWACSSMVITLAAAHIWSVWDPAALGQLDLGKAVKWMEALAVYVFCYALSGALLRRSLLRFVGPTYTWLIGILLMVLGIVLPVLIGYFFYSDQWATADRRDWFVGNPFVGNQQRLRSIYMIVPAVWAVMVFCLSIPWFIEKLRNFHGEGENAK